MFDQLTTLLLYAYLAEVVLRIENSSIYIHFCPAKLLFLLSNQQCHSNEQNYKLN